MMDEIRLPDGRRLSYAEYGDRSGLPVLFCHGAPGSRLQITEEMADAARASAMRIIVPDRPGYGYSDPRTGREFLDWPQDVSALMRTLGVRRFWVIGFSMGSAYALACTSALHEMVTGVSLAGSLAPNVFDPRVLSAMLPANSAIFRMAHDNPTGLRDTLNAMAPDADALYAAVSASPSAPDKELLAQPQIAAAFRRDSIETLRQGHDAIAADFILAAHDWHFDLKEIHAPVHVWSGEQDINTPPAMADYVASSLPHSRAWLLPGAGHFFLFSHWREIIGKISEGLVQRGSCT